MACECVVHNHEKPKSRKNGLTEGRGKNVLKRLFWVNVSPIARQGRERFENKRAVKATLSVDSFSKCTLEDVYFPKTKRRRHVQLLKLKALRRRPQKAETSTAGEETSANPSERDGMEACAVGVWKAFESTTAWRAKSPKRARTTTFIL